MMKTLIMARKTVVLGSVFWGGYVLGHYHAMSNPNEIRFRKQRKQYQELQEKKRQRKIIKQYKP